MNGEELEKAYYWNQKEVENGFKMA